MGLAHNKKNCPPPTTILPLLKPVLIFDLLANSYEPELHPGVTYRIRQPKATLKIFSTGSITVTAPSVANVQSAVEYIYPLVYPFQKPKTHSDIRVGANEKELLASSKAAAAGSSSAGSYSQTCGIKGNSRKRKLDDLDKVSGANKSDTSVDSD